MRILCHVVGVCDIVLGRDIIVVVNPDNDLIHMIHTLSWYWPQTHHRPQQTPPGCCSSVAPAWSVSSSTAPLVSLLTWSTIVNTSLVASTQASLNTFQPSQNIIRTRTCHKQQCHHHHLQLRIHCYQDMPSISYVYHEVASCLQSSYEVCSVVKWNDVISPGLCVLSSSLSVDHCCSISGYYHILIQFTQDKSSRCWETLPMSSSV